MLTWLIAGLLSLTLYIGCCIIVDGVFDPGTWEKVMLLIAFLLGPIGTVLMVAFITPVLWRIRKDKWPGMALLRQSIQARKRVWRIRRIKVSVTT
jgi:hypothetical protein